MSGDRIPPQLAVVKHVDDGPGGDGVSEQPAEPLQRLRFARRRVLEQEPVDRGHRIEPPGHRQHNLALGDLVGGAT
jgi:hypothetical protein